ncbi:hypothetical protein BGZ60DRAFT_32717 [Tricladium varicosporioides]|nr:hypothetical protein BGZ60DRAFT_32717 [Hymenoscyphus varicosporioides]
MNNTNGEKFLDSEKLLSDTPTSFSVDDEARLLNLSEEGNKKPNKMHHTPRLLALLVVFGLLAWGVVSTSTREFNVRRPFADCTRSRPVIAPKASPPAPEEIERFKELLNSVEPASLHEVLHEHLKEKYQHGVYQEDKTAMEVVHKQDAAVAQSLIELAKRQTSNTTTVATTSVGSTVTQAGSTTTVAPTTSAPSTSVAPTTTTVPATTSVPTTVVTSVSQATVQTETSTQAPATSGGKTSSQTTQAPGSTRTSNTTPAGAGTTSVASDSSITQQIVYKTTLANGAQSTVTSVTIVPANQAAQTGGSSKTSGGSASLQTNAANSRDIGVNAILGVVGMAAVAIL